MEKEITYNNPNLTAEMNAKYVEVAKRLTCKIDLATRKDFTVESVNAPSNVAGKPDFKYYVSFRGKYLDYFYSKTAANKFISKEMEKFNNSAKVLNALAGF